MSPSQAPVAVQEGPQIVPLDALFVSYRRTDDFAVDGIVEELRYHLGAGRVVHDVSSFVPSSEFPREIAERVASSRLLVVIIGGDWLRGIKDNPDDWVRREIEIALDARVPLLPLLLGSCALPAEEDLPVTLLPLRSRQALRLRSGEDSARDMRKVVAAVRLHVPPDNRRRAIEALSVLGTAGLAFVGGSWLGSKLLASAYAPMQWPNLLIGAAFALSFLVLALAGDMQRAFGAHWRPPKPLHHQRPLQLVATGAVALLGGAWLAPDVRDVEELFAALECTRAEVPTVAKKLATIQQLPRYVQNDDLQLAAKVLFVRQNPSLTEDQANDVLNFFQPYRGHSRPRVRCWALLCTAEAYRFVGKLDAQRLVFQDLAADSAATKWQRWYAYTELGAAYYAKHDVAQARKNWQLAIANKRTRGVLQNLAVLEEDESNWDAAERYYHEAVDTITRYKREKQLAVLADQEASVYSNWCNKLRKQAKTDAAGSAALRTRAKDKCHLAIAAYSAYFDARWNLARVQLDEADYPGATTTLQTALVTFSALAKGSPDSLRRFGYFEYGEQYTLWLLAVCKFLTNQPLAGDPILNTAFQAKVVGAGTTPPAAVEALLTELEARDLDLSDDRAILERMKRALYL